MQPQGPANPQGGPYNPYGQSPGMPPGQPPYPNNGAPYMPGRPYGQPAANAVGHGGLPQPAANPGAMPAYQAPPGMAGNRPAGPDMPPPPQAEATPYDFFMQPKPAQPLNPLPVAGRHYGNIPADYSKAGKAGSLNLKGKFPLIAGGGILLVIILFVASALAPKDQTGPQLLGIAQTQQEIVRVCTQGSSRATYRSTRYFAATCYESVATNQKDVLAYLAKKNFKVQAKQLAAKASADTDGKLKAAQSSSTYDAVLRQILGDELDSYDKALTAQLGVTTSSTGRDVLSKSQASAELLIKMVHDDSDKTEAAPDSSQ